MNLEVDQIFSKDNEKFTVKAIDYLQLFVFIAITSMPFFIGDEFLIIGTIFSLITFLSRHKVFDKFIFTYSLIFFFIFLLQSFFFSVLEINVIVGYLVRIFYAYFTIKVLGNKLAIYYVKIIYFFTLISFLFYFPTIFFQDQMVSLMEQLAAYIEPFQLHDPGRTHILVYTFGEQYTEGEGAVNSIIERNSGPFWEPGGFGVFLILAIIFETIHNRKILTRRNYIFLIATLTTLSTGTFLVLFFFVVSYLLVYRDFKKLAFLGLFVIVGIVVYANTFFLSEKVDSQLSNKQVVSLKYAPRTRFVSAQLDWIDFTSNPILGRGRFEQTRFDLKEDNSDLVLNHRNNGTTNLLVEFGVFGFITFFYYMYLSFKKYCIIYEIKQYFPIILVLVVILLGFSQMIFLKPFFIGLSFFFLSPEYNFLYVKSRNLDV